MPRIIHAAILTMLVVSGNGCNRDYGKPYVSPGPTPLSGTGEVTRYQRTKHHMSIGEIHQVWWEVGGSVLHSHEYLDCLIKKLPQRIQ